MDFQENINCGHDIADLLLFRKRAETYIRGDTVYVNVNTSLACSLGFKHFSEIFNFICFVYSISENVLPLRSGLKMCLSVAKTVSDSALSRRRTGQRDAAARRGSIGAAWQHKPARELCNNMIRSLSCAQSNFI